MVTFLTLCAIVGTGGLFLYLLSTYEKSKLDKIQKIREKKEEDFDGIDPRHVYGKNWNPEVQRPRICPCCGKALKKTEFLYAAMSKEIQSNGKKQVHIYGCRYCYLGLFEEENSETHEENLDF
ncbi:MAG: hypothetical protein L6Q54_09595 [Leptospiraceae bacterium]|nr:hypothetical protein [Leptospiraceae bacterium]MCK6381482.1 hypothetical protein [Leptospiraceae bacterium]NUM40197.1 hypothetical protein [Leptospiraceae bacterium]